MLDLKQKNASDSTNEYKWEVGKQTLWNQEKYQNCQGGKPKAQGRYHLAEL